ncbi:hypothetical protein [Promicromonospora sp. NPDC023987]
MATQEITKDNLEQTVAGDGIVLLDFWAEVAEQVRAQDGQQ